ncbi:flagellar L-ring protein [Desulfosarcina alkanivorans]|uniref:Flagellar L-ring protein n=1 Tax=Desulfosarcina alkanivorans TaxID=571177 RepID=A0A5K7YBK5_9BACT|nr:flagellar basal body L-ring protein FlgH [Desulfosarcina alkanivorans]BBO66782.1 flagellar L-ring protein [Desulfosarcina alkanivorans]
MIPRFTTDLSGSVLKPLAVMLLLGLGLSGCAGFPGTGSPVQSKAPSFDTAEQAARVPVPDSAASPPSDGSLWQDGAPLVCLFSDQKARTVGDIVTIKISESSAATNKASTATDRSSSLSASVDAFFNAEKRFPADQPFFNPFSKVAGGVESEFQGTGTTRRSGDLDAYITALVTQVLPNGNLMVTGSREVLINNENQIIQLTGVVRPRDINAKNQVLSTYIADARISYSGSGVVNDRQKPGWLTNIVNTVWPF